MTAPAPPSRQRFIQDALGLSVEEFLDGIQEWRTHGPHRTAKRLDAANVAVMADVDYLLSLSDVPASDVHIIQGSAVKNDRRVINRTGGINAAYVYQRFLKGATIRLHRAQHYLPRVAAFAGELAAALAIRVTANIYLTPEGGTGLMPHYDGHDVVVLQCVGGKRWRLYADFAPATPLPTNKAHRFNPQRHKPGAVEREVRMAPGDLLWLRRGLMHEAVPEGGGPSLHVTFALNTLTLGELMQGALELAAEEDVELRREIPWRERLNPEAFDAAAITSLAAEALASGDRAKRALRNSRQQWETARTPPVGHWFAAHGVGGPDGMARLEGRVAERVREIRRAANRPDEAGQPP